jgi:hypothetical protein
MIGQDRETINVTFDEVLSDNLFFQNFDFESSFRHVLSMSF